MQLPQVWWCNQGRCWRDESDAEAVCAAEVSGNYGRKYRAMVGEARRGDLVVHSRRLARAVRQPTPVTGPPAPAPSPTRRPRTRPGLPAGPHAPARRLIRGRPPFLAATALSRPLRLAT
jgi:hypothetical protein